MLQNTKYKEQGKEILILGKGNEDGLQILFVCEDEIPAHNYLASYIFSPK